MSNEQYPTRLADPARQGEEISLPAGGELRELTESFNVMSLQLRQHQAMLEEQVRERTTRLTTTTERLAELRNGQKMETFGALASGIAHDFNNLLSPVMGYSELLRSRLEHDAEGLEYIDEVLAATHRAKELVQQILSFSRNCEDKLRPVRVQPIVQAAIKFLRATIPAAIEIRQKLEPCDGTVLADQTQLQQVILNLCTNAVQTMHPGGGVLEIGLECMELDEVQARAHPGLRPGGYLQLIVKDSGHGMDQATQTRIFDPFFTTRGVGEGTGMGLSVVHGIVSRYGGGIKVHSEKGKGSTFEIFLPLYDEAEASTETPTEAAIKGAGRILFVDDEVALATMGQKVLGELGYEATAMTNSGEALAHFAAEPGRYDLVFTDLAMPGMDGLEFCRQVKSIRTNIPIILYSGNYDTLEPETAQRAGIAMLLKKPLRIGDIYRAIQRGLQEPRPDGKE